MTKKKSPYSLLSEKSFWGPAIASKNPLQINDLWNPCFKIDRKHVFATAGSCFAQHFSKAIQKNGFSWYDSEPAPADMDQGEKLKYHYGVFSFRTGNIYSVALLKQWVEWSLGAKSVESIEVWDIGGGKFQDPFRPNVVPEGYNSKEELYKARRLTLDSIKQTFQKSDIFVFTLGLTEAWVNSDTGLIYPMCPGTIAGDFDEKLHKFINYQYPEIRKSLEDTIELIKKVNPDIKFLFTVSPVPLTATASDEHVLTATVYSKSVLRAVAGDICHSRDDVDYFPSYEIISSYPFKGFFYQPNLRSVSSEGVDFVMKSFFACQGIKELKESTSVRVGHDLSPSESNLYQAMEEDDSYNQEVCEEILLEDSYQKITKKNLSSQSITKKVCVIGNSHAAALRKAWNTKLHKDNQSTEITFFGSPGTGLSKVVFENKVIKSYDEKVVKNFVITSGGESEILIQNYDLFFIHGHGFPLEALMQFLTKSQRSRDEISNYFVNKSKNILTKLAISLRNVTNKEIYLSLAPMWSELEFDEYPDKYKVLTTHQENIKDIYLEALEELLRPYNISLLLQPSSTLKNPYFTKKEYSLNYGNGAVLDYGHMGVNYGSYVLDDIIKCF